MIESVGELTAAALPRLGTATVLGFSVWCAEWVWPRMPRPLRTAFWSAVLVVPVMPALPVGLALMEDLPAAGSAEIDAMAASPWLHWFGIVWLLGSAAILLRGLRAWTVARAMVRRARRARVGAGEGVGDVWLAARAEAARRLAWRGRVPDVLMTNAFTGPAVVGWLRPSIVVPARLVPPHGPGDRGTHILLHEFAHVRRGDPWAALLCDLAVGLMWFHPLVRLARRRLRLLRELACDAVAAAASTCSPGESTYRDTLLEVARPLAAGPLAAVSFGGAGGAEILVRLRALESASSAPTRGHALLACAAFALATLCCSPVQRAALPPRPAAPAVSIEELMQAPGCLRLRYAMFAAFDPAAPTDFPSAPDRD